MNKQINLTSYIYVLVIIFKICYLVLNNILRLNLKNVYCWTKESHKQND